MRLATIVSLAVSAVLGIGALIVAKVAIPNAAIAKNPARQAPGVSIVVASRAIKYGDKLDAGMLTVIKVPANAAPEGAYTAVAQVLAADRGGAPVALFPLAAREPVLPAKLSGPGARASVAAEIAQGMRAYALKVTDATGVGGHALPGDHVDVVLLRDLTPQGPQRNFISYVVVQNARVLGLNLNADLTTDKPANPDTYTIEVSVEDAQKLSVATNLGTLSLALRKTGAAEIEDATPVRTGDFLVGGAPAAVRISAPSAPGPRPAVAPSEPWSAIMIVEGQSGKGSRTPRGMSAQPPTPTLNGVEPAAAAAPAAPAKGSNG